MTCWPPLGEASFFFADGISKLPPISQRISDLNLSRPGVPSLWLAIVTGLFSISGVTAVAENHFLIAEYRVIGNTALANRDIERLLYPLLGEGKSLADVEAARTALEKLYHDKGYGAAFVDIPPQTVRDGLVRLRVTEGRIESTKISGAKYFPERDVIAQLPASTPGSVLQISKLQQQLGTVNGETPDRAVVPVLKAGSAPGTVDLDLKVNDTLPLHGSLELNDQATVGTHELRSVAGLSYDDIFGRLDSLSLQYQFTPQQPDQVRVFGLNYVVHAFDSGLQPSFSYINSNSNVPTVGTLGVVGIGEITSAKLVYPIFNSPLTVQSLNVGADYKHFRNTINQNATTALDTPITYVNLSAGYNGIWRSDLQTTSLNVVVNAGPRGVVNNSTAFENDRFKGRSNYFDVKADLLAIFRLPGNFSLRLRAAGQEATEPLITNEDFSIAGVDGVRGYLEAEELADQAVKGTIQLTTPGLHADQKTIFDAYGFFDEGRGTVIDALPGEPGSVSLQSIGLGLDLLPGEKVTGSVAWARALRDASVTRAGDSRVLFIFRGVF
jgi:hemolysin activation/secretion protein